LDLSELSCAELTYWYQQTGGGESPDPGDDLLFEYMNTSGYWTEMPEARQYGSGPDMTYYEEVTKPLPAGALHAGFRLRVRSIGSSGGVYDDWFVDDISITGCENGAVPGALGFRLEDAPNLPATIEALGSIDVNVVFGPNAVGDYECLLVIRSDDRDEPEVELQLTGAGILDFLVVVPDSNFEFSGHPGGPFMPTYEEYSLTNNGPNVISWTAEPNVPWLDMDPDSGTLQPGESISVRVQPNLHAEPLPVGYHCAEVNFIDVTTTVRQIRRVFLNVYTEPKIWTNPHSFDVTVPQGGTQTEILTIGNTGGAVLNFALSSSESASEQQGGESSAAGSDGEANDSSVSSAPPEHDFSVLTDEAFAEGQLLVRFAPDSDYAWPDVAERDSILTATSGAVVEREYEIVPGLCLVQLPDGIPVAEAVASLNQTDGILYAQPNYKVEMDADPQNIPNDPSFNLQWNLHNTGQTGGTADADIDAPEAWDIATGSGDVIVAVIDTGVDYTHPDLAANMWVNEDELNGTPGFDDDGNGYVDDIYGYDFCTYGQSRDSDPMDDYGHGSHCAGIIGAVSNDATGVAGTCWNVKIMAVKFLSSSGNGWTSDAIDCVEYSALMGADLMSNSWGGGLYDQALKDAIDSAGQHGMLFVASAGNGYGNNNDFNPHYPSSYDCDNVIAVLSTDYDDQMSAHSNYGPFSVDLGAPGGHSHCTVYSCWRSGGYYYAYGTSMAAPHVSGACALIWSVCPSLAHLDVKDILLQTVDPLPTLSGGCVSGGRLNLHSAVLEAGASCRARWIEFMPDAGTVTPGETCDVNVVFSGDCSAGTYQGHITVSSDDPYVPEIIIPVTMTVEPVDYFTELFDPCLPIEPNDPNANDMANRTLMFAPYASGSYYRLCTNTASAFPVDPNGGTVVSLNDDDYVAVNLLGAHVDFYGESYDTFYIGSNGYISFGSGDIRHFESLADHFDLRRISVLFDDLDPSAGGTVSWKLLDDRAVVTFEEVPEYSFSNASSFQVEMLFDGRIRITLLGIAAQDGLLGLSDGGGLSPYFTESDLSGYGSCIGDLDGDTDSDLADFAVFATYWRKRGNMETVRDEFNGVTYSGNKGTQNWSGDWQELGESDGPGSGFLQVVSDGAMRLGHENEKDQPTLSLTREADLTGATMATLTYDYVAQNNGNAGSVSVQVSGDGGSNWTTLTTYSYDAGAGSAGFDITPYVSSNTQIRFEISSMTKIKMYLYVDNIQIEYDDPEHPWHPWCDGADLNHDFCVDYGDLEILLGHYLE
jgi:subtilisin family serine protease